MESENYGQKIDRSGHTWDFDTALSGYSGSGYMANNPDTGMQIDIPNIQSSSPEMIYNIDFTNTGTYYIWGRGAMKDSSGDTIHAGIDGFIDANSDALDWDGTSFEWSNIRASNSNRRFITVSSPGVHNISIWIREDGARVDKIMLTKDSAFIPTGTGPPESPRGDIRPPVRSNGAPTGTLSYGTTSTTISVTTNEDATCRYSTTPGVSYSSMQNTFTTTGLASHLTLITGLLEGNTYNYYVKCVDTLGNANTNDYLITFSVDAGDITPPSVSVIHSPASPTQGQTVTITATASDNVGVASIQIFLDGTSTKTCASSPCTYSSSSLPVGSHAYYATATDTSSNTGRDPLSGSKSFTVSDTTPPTVSVSHSPAN
ncbi:hypothetical protein HY419_01460, partial [candidate division WWE3 bacterium]|nr:hypothetical protein [candidate division WWE3 bacterium]